MKTGLTPSESLLQLMPELDGLAAGPDKRVAVRCMSPDECSDVLLELQKLGFTMDSFSRDCGFNPEYQFHTFPHPLIKMSRQFVCCCADGHSNLSSGAFVSYDDFMDAVSDGRSAALTLPDSDAFSAQLDTLFL